MSDRSRADVTRGQFHFNPATYLENIRREVPDYDVIQDTLVKAASRMTVERFIDLGAGTGETALRIFNQYPEAEADLIELQSTMLPLLRERFRDRKVAVHEADIGGELPPGPYCLAISAFAVHHLEGVRKRGLFERLHSMLRPGGMWIFADVYIPEKEEDRKTPINRSHDFPSTMAEVENWLRDVGFLVERLWQKNDLAVFACRK